MVHSFMTSQIFSLVILTFGRTAMMDRSGFNYNSVPLVLVVPAIDTEEFNSVTVFGFIKENGLQNFKMFPCVQFTMIQLPMQRYYHDFDHNKDLKFQDFVNIQS